MSEDFIPVIKEDGSPLSDEEVVRISEGLDALDEDERVAARNENAADIAGHAATRMLIVSGPGTGKSTLFKKRLIKWLEVYPDRRVAVATFVRKLVGRPGGARARPARRRRARAGDPDRTRSALPWLGLPPSQAAGPTLPITRQKLATRRDLEQLVVVLAIA